MVVEKISMLCPTRQRPENMKNVWNSAFSTSDNPDKLQICYYIDNDDQESLKTYNEIAQSHKVGQICCKRGPRIVLSKMWNEACKISNGDILMHCGDDIVFKTKGWDSQVREAFNQWDDKIGFVFGQDGAGYTNDQNFGTHGFIHRNWVDAVGYFVPPYFSSDYNDTWLNEVADMIGRKQQISMLTEHMHPALGKGEWDANHTERLQRHKDDDVKALYESLKQERLNDAATLRNHIDSIS